MTIHPYLLLYDVWVGVFIDVPKRRLYLQPLPCVGLRIDFSKSSNAKEP